MKSTRALFRAWLLISGIWVVAVGYVAVAGWPSAGFERLTAQEMRECAPVAKEVAAKRQEHAKWDAITPDEFHCEVAVSLERSYAAAVRAHAFGMSNLMLLPPAGLFLAGWLVLGIGRRLRRDATALNGPARG
jgi:hypothetical protein